MKNMTFKNTFEFYCFINSLDTYNRILIGQFEVISTAIDTKFKFNSDVRKKINELFLIRKYFIPKLNADAGFSLGIWNNNTPQNAIKSFDIQQTLRYEMSYHLHQEGGIGIDFHAPLIKGNWNQELFKNNDAKYKDYVPAKFISFNPIEIEFTDECEELLKQVKLIDECLNKLEILKIFEILYGNIEDDNVKNKIKDIEKFICEIHKHRLENV